MFTSKKKNLVQTSKNFLKSLFKILTRFNSFIRLDCAQIINRSNFILIITKNRLIILARKSFIKIINPDSINVEIIGCFNSFCCLSS